MISVSNDELISARDFQRELGKRTDALKENDDVEKIVITKHGKMEFVVLTVADYERLSK